MRPSTSAYLREERLSNDGHSGRSFALGESASMYVGSGVSEEEGPDDADCEEIIVSDAAEYYSVGYAISRFSLLLPEGAAPASEKSTASTRSRTPAAREGKGARRGAETQAETTGTLYKQERRCGFWNCRKIEADWSELHQSRGDEARSQNFEIRISLKHSDLFLPDLLNNLHSPNLTPCTHLASGWMTWACQPTRVWPSTLTL